MVPSRSLLIEMSVMNCKSAIKQSTVGALVEDDCLRIQQGLLLVTTVQ